MRRWVVLLVDVAAWLALGVAVHVIALREVSWSWQPAIVLAAFTPYFAATAAVLAIALFALRRRWDGLGLAIIATVLLIIFEAPLFVGPSDHPGPGAGAPLHVLQANLRIGSADAGHLVGLVTHNRVDVLTTEELTPAELDRLDAAGIASVLPYRFVNPQVGGTGVGIFSRYPLSNEVYNGRDFYLGLETASVAGPAGPVALIAVHLTPPWPFPSWHWVGEIKRLGEMIRQVPTNENLVVSGDFNATFDNAQFRALLSGPVRDAAEASGAGLLRTYPADRFFPPLIGIDHVLTRNLTAQSVHTVALTGSDHRGLLVDLTN